MQRNRSSDGKAVLKQKKDNPAAMKVATSAAALKLNSGNPYTANVLTRP